MTDGFAIIPAFPVPAPAGIPDWAANAIVFAGGVAIFALVLWQVVRAFRRNRDGR